MHACLSEGCYPSLSSISAIEHSAIDNPAHPISYLAKQVNLILTAACYLAVSLIYFTRSAIFAFHPSVIGLQTVLPNAKKGWLTRLCVSLSVWHCHMEEGPSPQPGIFANWPGQTWIGRRISKTIEQVLEIQYSEQHEHRCCSSSNIAES